MTNQPSIYIWRCAKCSNHFSNISKIDGVMRQDKKCPKCKSLNRLTLTNKEIFVQCKFFDSNANDYRDEFEDTYTYTE